ncbi:hypothetical protein M413DRAFT_181710 [Hebeloma cylindrosporum]|uniref:Uncharacterized protein n=1 Tax=Hebeloma cylindrosporum TaxID=76867 RepID=A0A0C2YFD2_HEBCY|nr:hypothetical protein M413DRAFT_181710 [Hebeloma cylindrosporum h7]
MTVFNRHVYGEAVVIRIDKIWALHHTARRDIESLVFYESISLLNATPVVVCNWRTHISPSFGSICSDLHMLFSCHSTHSQLQESHLTISETSRVILVTEWIMFTVWQLLVGNGHGRVDLEIGSHGQPPKKVDQRMAHEPGDEIRNGHPA